MFLQFSKSKVKNWISKNATDKNVLKFVLPLALMVLKAVAQKTKNKYDNEVAEALEVYLKNNQL